MDIVLEGEVSGSFGKLPLEIVSKGFDLVARSILNSSFFRFGDQLEKAMSNVKKMLPKRESQRRYHSLSRVNEVYSALETRYALLSMTFRKHIEDNLCCFMAGKVLDEGFAVLRVLDECVKKREQPRETQELLRDVRDYSSMAMEYFDEHIAPTLLLRDPLSMLYRSRCRYSLSSLPSSSPTISDTFPCTPSPSKSLSLFGSPVAQCLGDWMKLQGWRKILDEKVKKHERTIAEQGRVIREQSRAINSIIECMHQISSKISLTSALDLKSVEELSQPCPPNQLPAKTASLIAPAPEMQRKRKASTTPAVVPKKSGKSVS